MHERRAVWWSVCVVLAALFLMGVGGLLVLAGETDDSPGLGGLGLINAAIGIGMLVARFTK